MKDTIVKHLLDIRVAGSDEQMESLISSLIKDELVKVAKHDYLELLLREALNDATVEDVFGTEKKPTKYINWREGKVGMKQDSKEKLLKLEDSFATLFDNTLKSLLSDIEEEELTEEPKETTVSPKEEPKSNPHYKQGKIEVISIIDDNNLNFNCGNIVKYTLRADHKGTPREDKKKALNYAFREVYGEWFNVDNYRFKK